MNKVTNQVTFSQFEQLAPLLYKVERARGYELDLLVWTEVGSVQYHDLRTSGPVVLGDRYHKGVKVETCQLEPDMLVEVERTWHSATTGNVVVNIHKASPAETDDFYEMHEYHGA